MLKNFCMEHCFCFVHCRLYDGWIINITQRGISYLSLQTHQVGFQNQNIAVLVVTSVPSLLQPRFLPPNPIPTSK